jgi:hypothetical protein
MSHEQSADQLRDYLAPDEWLSAVAAVKRGDREGYGNVVLGALRRMYLTGPPEQREFAVSMTQPTTRAEWDAA